MKVWTLLFQLKRENVNPFFLFCSFLHNILDHHFGVFQDLAESEASNKIATQRVEVFIQSDGNLDVLLIIHGPLEMSSVLSVKTSYINNTILLMFMESAKPGYIPVKEAIERNRKWFSDFCHRNWKLPGHVRTTWTCRYAVGDYSVMLPVSVQSLPELPQSDQVLQPQRTVRLSFHLVMQTIIDCMQECSFEWCGLWPSCPNPPLHYPNNCKNSNSNVIIAIIGNARRFATSIIVTIITISIVVVWI